MIQNVIIYVVLGLALAYLTYKFFWRKKKTGCNNDCDCH
ncbi:MAG: FeoB-associated Cys-rich membrane protein [Bacteroidetes bacterium]|nr:FeoB-associated Cys-rich membrane protein [Bacteroidota bacterium]